jgi:hypothetical protein
LAAEATRLVNEGATNEEVVAWLDHEESVAEVEGDSDSIRFRPIGGRGVWVTRSIPTAAQRTGLAPGLTPGLAREAVAYAGDWHASEPRGGTGQTVTGEGRSLRRALVLSPFRWDFGETDDGEAVAEQLRARPDYANGVAYAENATVDATDVSVDDFRGWQELQVVHVVSHGFRLCKEGKCRAVVAANALPGGTANIWPSAVRGLELEVQVGPAPAQPPRYFTLLGADFFRDQYPGGLDDTVVFLNGCSTFGPGATDLADAVRGTTSVVLGWNRPVGSQGAETAALALYAELAGDGRTVGDALGQLGSLTTTESQNAAGQTVVATLSSSGRAFGGDLRIRDVVDFQDQAGAGPLVDGAAVQLIGTPDDGAPDSIGWQLRVDGIGAEAGPATATVTIDGHASPPVAVSTGALEGTSTWRLSGVVDLGVDVSVPHPAQFEVALQLPEGGESVDVVQAVLVAESEPTPSAGAPAMGSVWRGHATDRIEVKPGVHYLAEADLVFTLDPDTAQGKYLSYVLTGGTMTVTTSGTTDDGTCTDEGTSGPITITPEMAAAASNILIDTGSSPPTFYASIHVVGPIFEVMQTCTGDYAYLTGPYSTRAQGTFIHVFSDEARQVVDFRISGASLYGDRTFNISRSQ